MIFYLLLARACFVCVCLCVCVCVCVCLVCVRRWCHLLDAAASSVVIMGWFGWLIDWLIGWLIDWSIGWWLATCCYVFMPILVLAYLLTPTVRSSCEMGRGSVRGVTRCHCTIWRHVILCYKLSDVLFAAGLCILYPRSNESYRVFVLRFYFWIKRYKPLFLPIEIVYLFVRFIQQVKISPSEFGKLLVCISSRELYLITTYVSSVWLTTRHLYMSQFQMRFMYDRSNNRMTLTIIRTSVGWA